MYHPLVSIIIPTYNEEKDIKKCLSKAQSLDYDRKEIIVVDGASTDNTPAILEEYERRGDILFIREPERRGVARARNLGVSHARGEIIVLLNADVMLERDFLAKVIQHYQDGADFVVCWSEVLNDSYLLPAFVNASAHKKYANRTDYVWSEGFSCRREAFLDVGGFKPFPKASAGEDRALGLDLNRQYQRVLDKSIIVKHIVPTRLSTFLRLRYERGKGAAFFERFYEKRSTRRQVIKLFAEKALSFLLLVTLLFDISIVCMLTTRTVPISLNILFFSITTFFNLVVLSGVIGKSIWNAIRVGVELSQHYPEFRFPFIILYFLSSQFAKVGFIRGALMRFSKEQERFICTVAEETKGDFR